MNETEEQETEEHDAKVDVEETQRKSEHPVKEDAATVVGMLAEANKAAERLEEANKVTEKLLKDQAAMKLEKTIGGSANAGAPRQTKDEKEIANAKKYLEGTGMEDMLDEQKKEKTTFK